MQGYGISPFDYDLFLEDQPDLDLTPHQPKDADQIQQIWSPFHLAVHLNRPLVVELFLEVGGIFEG